MEDAMTERFVRVVERRGARGGEGERERERQKEEREGGERESFSPSAAASSVTPGHLRSRELLHRNVKMKT